MSKSGSRWISFFFLWLVNLKFFVILIKTTIKTIGESRFFWWILFRNSENILVCYGKFLAVIEVNLIYFSNILQQSQYIQKKCNIFTDKVIYSQKIKYTDNKSSVFAKNEIYSKKNAKNSHEIEYIYKNFNIL